MRENIAYAIIVAALIMVYLTIVFGRRIPWLGKSALIINHIGLGTCALALQFTGLDKQMIAGYLIQFVIQNTLLTGRAGEILTGQVPASNSKADPNWVA